MIDARAQQVAERLGIETYGDSIEVDKDWTHRYNLFQEITLQAFSPNAHATPNDRVDAAAGQEPAWVRAE